MTSITAKKTRISDNILLALIGICTFFSAALIVVIIVYVFSKGIPFFKFKDLISPQSALTNPNGLLGNIINTLYIILGTLLLACPIGIGGAIYLNEYAKNKKFVEAVSFATEVLSGIPSIIFGLFGMIFFGELLGFKYSILTGCFTLTLLILPIIIRSTQTALASVPESYREAARGLGATKWYMIHTVILPRRDFFSHFLESGGTLTIQLYIAMTNAQYGQAFVIGMILIVLIFLMNALAKWITKHFDVNTKE